MKPLNYSRTIIYKIVPINIDLHLIYVGHTTNFIVRKCAHKSSCTNISGKHYNLKLYKMINENGGWDKWDMIQIERYPCSDGNEARARERYWYELYNANLNMCCPIVTKEERLANKQKWAEKNKDKCIASKTKYYEKNRDACIARTKEWRLQKRLEKLNSV
jgi:hypothetical protein